MTPKGRHVNFAQDPLCSYFHEPPKNEIHLLHVYLHCVFTSFLFIFSGFFYLNLANKWRRKVIIRSLWLLRSMAVTMT